MNTPKSANPIDLMPKLWRSYHLLFRNTQQIAEERLETFYREGCGLELRMIWVLMAAAEAPPSQAFLAEILHINPNVMVELIDKMEAKRLVKRVRNPENRREHRLDLTAKGRDAVAWVEKHSNEAARLAWAPVTIEELDEVAVLARKILVPYYARRNGHSE
jgi:DNA-binding MarR family transcriptional regulator